MASDLVPAIWRGPFDGLLPNMGVVCNGDEHLVTPADLLSGHWEAVKPAPRPATEPVAAIARSDS